MTFFIYTFVGWVEGLGGGQRPASQALYPAEYQVTTNLI